MVSITQPTTTTGQEPATGKYYYSPLLLQPTTTTREIHYQPHAGVRGPRHEVDNEFGFQGYYYYTSSPGAGFGNENKMIYGNCRSK